jgi:hypothetical protein
VVLGSVARANALFSELRRVLKPGAILVLRHFFRPSQPIGLNDLHAALLAGAFGSFQAFKWQLAYVLHGDLTQGVLVADIWRAWNAMQLDVAALAEQLSWPGARVRIRFRLTGKLMPSCRPDPTASLRNSSAY